MPFILAAGLSSRPPHGARGGLDEDSEDPQEDSDLTAWAMRRDLLMAAAGASAMGPLRSTLGRGLGRRGGRRETRPPQGKWGADGRLFSIAGGARLNRALETELCWKLAPK